MQNTDKESLSPAVSVIIILYNRPQYVGEAIESVLNQTFSDFEFIVIDNGSDDMQSYNIADKHGQCDQRMRVLRIDNRPLPAAFNFGLSVSKVRTTPQIKYANCSRR